MDTPLNYEPFPVYIHEQNINNDCLKKLNETKSENEILIVHLKGASKSQILTSLTAP